jgi:hypothetical protein
MGMRPHPAILPVIFCEGRQSDALCSATRSERAPPNAFATQRDDPITQIFRTRALLFRPEQRRRKGPGMVRRLAEIIQPRIRREPCTEKSKSSAAISASA